MRAPDARLRGRVRQHRALDDLTALTDGDLSVKYLAALVPEESPAPVDPPCVFQDMRDAEWHLDFLTRFPAFRTLDYDTYLGLVLRRPSTSRSSPAW